MARHRHGAVGLLRRATVLTCEVQENGRQVFPDIEHQRRQVRRAPTPDLDAVTAFPFSGMLKNSFPLGGLQPMLMCVVCAAEASSGHRRERGRQVTVRASL
eukprot:1324925-Rhodomonas_salina.6